MWFVLGVKKVEWPGKEQLGFVHEGMLVSAQNIVEDAEKRLGIFCGCGRVWKGDTCLSLLCKKGIATHGVMFGPPKNKNAFRFDQF